MLKKIKTRIYAAPAVKGLTYVYDYLIITGGNKNKLFHYRANLESLETQNILITFVQCRTNVEDVALTLYKCYKNVLCMLAGIAASVESKIYSEENSRVLINLENNFKIHSQILYNCM